MLTLFPFSAFASGCAFALFAVILLCGTVSDVPEVAAVAVAVAVAIAVAVVAAVDAVGCVAAVVAKVVPKLGTAAVLVVEDVVVKYLHSYSLGSQ